MNTENPNPEKEQDELQTNEVPHTEQSIEEKLQEDLGKERDKFIRLFAEFENYKKRTSKERLELFSTANEEVISSLLPVLDDFDRALAQITERDENQHTLGFTLIANKFRDTLSSKGLQEVDVQKGEEFNVDVSEAVTQIPAGEEMRGKVVDVIEKGYKLGDKIIRFSKVVIGQ